MDENLRSEGAKALTTDSDPKIKLTGPDCRGVRFRGNPIWASNPQLNNLTIPGRLAHHPLVANRFCFSLPRALWNQVHQQFGSVTCDAETVDFENTLGEICADHSSRVGFWNGRAIAYNLLRRPTSLRFSADAAKVIGIHADQVKLDHVARIFEERSQGLSKASRAYAGWLLTNKQFLHEHDALFDHWTSMVGRWGLNRLGILLPPGILLSGDDPTADPLWPAYSSAFEEFFVRWRLQGLAAPYLPIPLQPLMGGQFPISILPQVMRAAGLFVLPDIFPIPSRDSLRGMLDDSLHGQQPPEHLAEWMKLIASDNSAKQAMIRFERVFELQHYWRVLQHRHHRILYRKTGALTELLAAFLATSGRTIHGDLLEIRKRLGADWVARGSGTAIGPL